MRALWIESQQLSLREIEPKKLEDTIEVAVKLAGICGTDLELLKGYYDFVGVPGHEFVGEIVSGPDAGKRVVADINFGCGLCSVCLTGSRHHCPSRQVLGIKGVSGAFAETVYIPKQNLIPVPEHVTDWQAAQAEPLAAALQILEQVTPAGSVLVVGAGRLGRMVARVVSAFTPEADLSVCMRRDSPSLREEFRCVSVAEVNANTYDFTIDCTGQPEGFALAMQAIRPRGNLIAKSTYSDRLQLDMSRVVVDEIQILGSRCGPMEKAIECLANGTISLPAENLAYYSLADYVPAIERAKNPNTEKVFFHI
jgi:threonine dehydrogenase-like Zn-dependent dehydrogenase